MKDLMPKGGSLEDNFDWNQLEGHPSRDGGKNYVALRISLVNSSEDGPNAELHYNEIYRVEILKAKEEIVFKRTPTFIARSTWRRDHFIYLIR